MMCAMTEPAATLIPGTLIDVLRALADPTRLRIMRLLTRMELAVGELAQVLDQSQPRVSRHIRILAEAGLAERRREGSWVFVRGVPGTGDASLASAVAGLIARGEAGDPAFAAQAEADRLRPGHGRRANPGHAAYEHPTALAAALGQPGFGQDTNMARNARLRLVEHLGKLAHRQFHPGQQTHDPQPRGIGQRAQDIDQGGGGLGHAQHHIKNSLYDATALADPALKRDARR